MLVAIATLVQIALVGAFFALGDKWRIVEPISREQNSGGLVEFALREGLNQPSLLVSMASVSLWVSVYLLHRYVTPETSHPFLVLPLSGVVFVLLAVVLLVLVLCAATLGVVYFIAVTSSAH